LVSLRLLADSATAPLLRELTSSYRLPHGVIAWNIEVGEVPTLLEWLKTGEAPYALTPYLPSAGMAASPLWTAPIGQDGIAFVLNPLNPITNLTAAQLRSILQGRVDNWKAVGGTDSPLTVVAQSDGSSAAVLIQSIVLGDRHVTRTARLATTAQAVISMVAAEPGAIGYVSMGLLTGSVRAVAVEGILPTPDTVAANQYPIRAPLVFTGPRPPQDDAYRAFFAWVQSPDGQMVVRRHYGGLATPR
jgi:phosphate transport system substrate-binding protein